MTNVICGTALVPHELIDIANDFNIDNLAIFKAPKYDWLCSWVKTEPRFLVPTGSYIAAAYDDSYEDIVTEYWGMEMIVVRINLIATYNVLSYSLDRPNRIGIDAAWSNMTTILLHEIGHSPKYGEHTSNCSDATEFARKWHKDVLDKYPTPSGGMEYISKLIDRWNQIAHSSNDPQYIKYMEEGIY